MLQWALRKKELKVTVFLYFFEKLFTVTINCNFKIDNLFVCIYLFVL